jgi:general secretion pathway protein L
MTSFIVRPPWAAQAAWVGARLDAAASLPSLGNWAQAQDIPQAKELILAVPAPLLSWHRVSLPKLAANRWRAALDSLLEDRLLADPAQVHLAMAPTAQAGQALLVAACDKAWLTQALQALEKAGHRVARIVPEFEPGPERLHLQGQPDQGWLVHCSPTQVQCLPLSQPAQASLQVWRSLMPREVSLSTEPALAVTARALSERDVPLMPASQVLQEAANSAWNLAQFDLASRSSWHQRLGRRASHWLHDAAWRPARLGLAALLALQVLGLQLWAWQEKRDLAQREQAVADVLTSTFTQVKLVIDPALQMERETALLAQSRGQASSADLTRMLAALASVAGTVPKSLDYKPGELSLSGWQPPNGTSWKDSLSRQGFRLDAAGERWVMRPATEGAAR